ncbi:glycosyltransferase family 4 protein [Fibrella sp. HMF5335]|uniref:Glycosyltransferase family 4 protein n=1 Tax=Fibrella rubiginis TaxID=2817060 RepID=A0A939GCE2_9BACT|nr:glycosyltransferase family 4 protein [Fibrella rubiginis]MBO0934970.1 glycosyltransferase family 4 protein [Fibrella rubiginis]
MIKTAIHLLIVNTHPIQYFAPLYRELAADTAFDVTVLYCSRHGLSGEVDRQFGTAVQWDIPLLDGYTHAFLSNQSPRPSIHGFWGLFNLSVIRWLWQAPKGVVIINGWASATCWLTILFGRLFGHTVCMRADSSNVVEQQKSPHRIQLRRWVLERGLFPMINYFLYIGQQNRAFYQFFGVAQKKLIHGPFSVDNSRFQQQYQLLKPQRMALREAFGLSPDHFVIVFSGKYLPNKRPLDLLKAVHQLQRPNVAVVLVGEGSARNELAAFVQAHHMDHVLLTGFVNQSVIGQYYAVADAYAMCSTIETWGLSTNEAMNFGLPVVLSDTIGCVADLVQEGVNGYTYPCGDVGQLADRLARLMDMPPCQRQAMGQASLTLINQYGYAKTVDSLKAALHPTRL